MKLLLALPLLALTLSTVGCTPDDEVEIEREPGGVEVERD
jgi:hypothetical protein